MSNILQKLKEFRKTMKNKKKNSDNPEALSEVSYEKNYSENDEKQIDKVSKEKEAKEKEAIDKLENQLEDEMARKEKEINDAIEKAGITDKSLNQITDSKGWMGKMLSPIIDHNDKKKLKSDYLNLYNKITYLLNLDLEQLKYQFDKRQIEPLKFSGDEITIKEVYYSIKYGNIDTGILLNINNIINKLNNIVVEYLYCRDKIGCLNKGDAVFNFSSLINEINEQVRIITNNLSGTLSNSFNTFKCLGKFELINTIVKARSLSVYNAFQEYAKIPSNPELLLNLNLSDISKVLSILISNIHCVDFDIDKDNSISAREKDLQREITSLFQSINELIANIIKNKKSIHNKDYILSNIDENINSVIKQREENIKTYNIDITGGKRMQTRKMKKKKKMRQKIKRSNIKTRKMKSYKIVKKTSNKKSRKR